MTVKKMVHGQLVNVTVCPPSNRKAGLGITKPRYQRINSSRGERFIARDNGQIEEK